MSSVLHKDLKNLHYTAWMSFLEKSDGWSREEIRVYQAAQLRRVSTYAYENAFGYRNSFDETGFDPDDVSDVVDIRKIPFLSKEDIRDRLEEFSTAVDGRYYITTGGSTGVPTGMYRDPVSFGKELASKAHQYHRIGWREGDPQIVFRGLQIETPDRMEFAEEFNELRCSTYEFGTGQMEAYRLAAFDFKPMWLRCYPSSGYVFAKFLKDTGRAFPSLKGILCSSEQLYDFQKELFVEVFGPECRVFVHYGHYEMAALAGFCEYTDDYHVLPQYGLVELLDADDQPVTTPGMVGEIVATSFIMEATPFIRYRTQDLAVYKSDHCEKCGRPYQIWEKIEGRLQELVATGSGRLISTSMLNMHDDSYDQMLQFQFHQAEAGTVTLRFIPRDSFNTEIGETVRKRLQGKLGDDVTLVMQPVTSIPLTKRGKHRLLIQELDLKFDHPSLARAIEL